MGLLIGFLTVVLVINCLLLILLVLIQLPKKEAGAGLAFGGAASDALFGAGSGNALTKITKYATVAFFLLAMVLSGLQSHYSHREANAFKRAYQQQQSKAPEAPAGLPVAAPQQLAPLTLPTNTVPAAAPPGTNRGN